MDAQSWKTRLVEASPLAAQVTKEMLAETAQHLLLELRRLREKADAGRLVGDEARSIPAVTSNLRRILESLQLMDEAKKAPDSILDDLG